MSSILSLVAILFVDPVTSARWTEQWFGIPRGKLVRIVRRESANTRVGVHERDAWASDRVYRAAVRVGWLHPEWCPFHQPGPGWSTRGTDGLMAAFNLHRAHVPCLPRQLLDLPMFSHYLAALRWLEVCRHRPDGWCPT